MSQVYYRGAVEKKSVLENLDLVLLAMDEIVDKGCVISTGHSASMNWLHVTR